MTATELARDDNPRWLASLVTAVPVALAALYILSIPIDTSRMPPAVPTSKPAPARAVPPADPDTTLARAP